MDFDMFDSSPEGQIELMDMMIQLEKLNDDLLELPPADHNGHFSGSSQQTLCDSPVTPTSLPFEAPPQPPSFLNGTSLQEPPTLIKTPNSPTAKAEQWLGSSAYSGGYYAQPTHSVAAMREMIFRIAAMQPIYIDPETVRPPKRRNVKVSKDPQSVAARHRRERISERIRILQRLVPGGTKMDTASMLDEAIHYLKFLKTQVQSLERAATAAAATRQGIGGAARATTGLMMPSGDYSCYGITNDQLRDQGMFMMDSAYMLS